MTVIYDGCDLYTVQVGFQTLSLSRTDIDEIQSWDFDCMIEMKSSSDLNNIIDELEEKISDAERKIEDLEEENFDLTEQIIEYDRKNVQ